MRELRIMNSIGADNGGITPAYAGTTSPQNKAPLLSGDHPRLRGNYCDRIGTRLLRSGSPPLTRELLLL